MYQSRFIPDYSPFCNSSIYRRIRAPRETMPTNSCESELSTTGKVRMTGWVSMDVTVVRPAAFTKMVDVLTS